MKLQHLSRTMQKLHYQLNPKMLEAHERSFQRERFFQTLNFYCLFVYFLFLKIILSKLILIDFMPVSQKSKKTSF